MRHPKLVRTVDQLKMIAPTVAVMLFSISAGSLFLTLSSMQLDLLLASYAVPKDVVDVFAARVHGYYVAFSVISLVLAVLATLWSVWISFKVFGPFKRLEKQFQELEEGKISAEALSVRQDDTIYPLIQTVRRLLIAARKR